MYQAGFNGSAKIGGVSLCVKGWKASISADMLDVTTTCSSGWHENIVGLKQATGTIDLFVDDSTGPTVTVGSSVDLKLYFDQAGTHGYEINPALIKSVDPSVDVTGAITYSCSFQSSGAVIAS